MTKRSEPTPLPSDAQWEVLNIIWGRGEFESWARFGRDFFGCRSVA